MEMYCTGKGNDQRSLYGTKRYGAELHIFW